MSKPTQLSEIDEARRVLGMLDCVTNKDEYKKIFGYTDKDIKNFQDLLGNRTKLINPKFNELNWRPALKFKLI